VLVVIGVVVINWLTEKIVLLMLSAFLVIVVQMGFVVIQLVKAFVSLVLSLATKAAAFWCHLERTLEMFARRQLA
jgi:hypothetical protein